MKAVVYSKFGSPDVLRLQEVEAVGGGIEQFRPLDFDFLTRAYGGAIL